VYKQYQQYAQQAPPQQVYQAHQQAYQQLPPDQQQAIDNDVIRVLQQYWVSLQQVGVQPNQPTPQIYAKAGQYISHQPDLLHQVLGPGGGLAVRSRRWCWPEHWQWPGTSFRDAACKSLNG
jgi:hypothetical protein